MSSNSAGDSVPTRASIRGAKGQGNFHAPKPKPEPEQQEQKSTQPKSARTENFAMIVSGILFLSGVLLAVFQPIWSALFFTFVASLAVFGIYALYAVIVHEPTSWGSFGKVWFFATLSCLITYFVMLMAGVGPNAGSYSSAKACKLYYSTLEANAKGNLSQSDYVEQMLEVEKLTQKSDDQGIKAAGMSSALHKACTQAGY